MPKLIISDCTILHLNFKDFQQERLRSPVYHYSILEFSLACSAIPNRAAQGPLLFSVIMLDVVPLMASAILQWATYCEHYMRVNHVPRDPRRSNHPSHRSDMLSDTSKITAEFRLACVTDAFAASHISHGRTYALCRCGQTAGGFHKIDLRRRSASCCPNTATSLYIRSSLIQT